MRKQVLFILSLFLAINLHAENKFVIEGRVANVPDGLIVELLRNEDNVGMLVASDTLRNGKFRFEEETSGNGTDWMFLEDAPCHFALSAWLDFCAAKELLPFDAYQKICFGNAERLFFQPR